MRKSRAGLLTLMILVIFTITTVIIFNILTRKESEVRKVNLTVEQKILRQLETLPENYRIRQLFNDNITSTFIKNLKLHTKINKVEYLWNEVNSWISATQLYDAKNTNLGNVAYSLKTALIEKADVDTRGTQLKLLLTLKGKQQVIFKPKWYEKEKVIEGPVYSGKDRYGSEIIGFYLSAILNKPLTPLSVERQISLSTEIVPVATKRLSSTFFKRRNETCVYGLCLYCKRADPICDIYGYLKGAVIFNVKAKFEIHRSPWQRTYKNAKLADWEVKDDYCRFVRERISKKRLLDLIDIAIFDFLIQNGDRHHYETFEDNVVMLDNGKGLGNPFVDHIDILAPLFQCCILRGSTWKRLKMISGGFLRETLEAMPDINNFVTEFHLDAMERRLLIVYAAVEYCRNRDKVRTNLF